KLLEIVVPSGLSNEVLATGFALGNRMGKVPVRSANSEGFIGNRILGAYSKVAGYMMEDGTSPYRIDEAVRDFGYPIGPFQMFDLAGGDIGWANRKRKATTRDPRERYVEIADRLCERGWFGQKTGRGFYLYEEGSRIGIEDPEVLDIIAGERSTKGIKAREYSPEEIIRRYLGAMVNEAAKVLEEKVARCPSDIDVVQHYGYGFPRYRGGPLKYADMYGIQKIVKDIEEFFAEDPFFWKPSELLKTMAAQGQTFEDLNL
ncbi:MAG: 3-hydroxyacyl-CoA dehydrogenase family protein, partial [SAR324 cluster bacterium]|nr:3-hydroxyacyl-CoA dehydrogenase family protein [SAR324 cluster bacterium]